MLRTAPFCTKLRNADGTAVTACDNSPSSITTAGGKGAVEHVLELADEVGVLRVVSMSSRPITRLTGADHEDDELAVSVSSATGGRITPSCVLTDLASYPWNTASDTGTIHATVGPADREIGSLITFSGCQCQG